MRAPAFLAALAAAAPLAAAILGGARTAMRVDGAGQRRGVRANARRTRRTPQRRRQARQRRRRRARACRCARATQGGPSRLEERPAERPARPLAGRCELASREVLGRQEPGRLPIRKGAPRNRRRIRRPRARRDGPGACGKAFEDWAQPYADAFEVEIAHDPPRAFPWNGKIVDVDSMVATTATLGDHDQYAAVYATYPVWPKACLILGIAIPARDELDRAKAVRDRFANEVLPKVQVTSSAEPKESVLIAFEGSQELRAPHPGERSRRGAGLTERAWLARAARRRPGRAAGRSRARGCRRGRCPGRAPREELRRRVELVEELLDRAADQVLAEVRDLGVLVHEEHAVASCGRSP